MKKFHHIGLLVFILMFLLGLTSAHAIMGLGKCVKACDGDRECIKACRDQFLSEDQSKEVYMDEFRQCHEGCDKLRGAKKEKCLNSCRDDYKLGRDLPRD